MLDFRWLNPSKRKAMWYGLLWGGIAFLFLVWQWWPCMFSALVVFAFYAVVWYRKYNRDQKIIAGVISSPETLPPASAGVRSHAPPMTSKGSSRLFVPPPLTDR